MGRAYDPLMWLPTYEKASDTQKIRNGLMPSGRSTWPSVVLASPESSDHGGGNTLRIGRAEHPRFEVPEEDGDGLVAGQHAAHLLDLFHVGKPKSADEDQRMGNLVKVDGKVNLNTATETAIRALLVGNLGQDPMLSKQLSKNHLINDFMAPPTTFLELGTPTREKAGDVIVEAIIGQRPFASAAELASIEAADGEKIFGNREMYREGTAIQWSDSAAEEIYGRIFEASTFRSRNFRVWVVGQAIAPRSRNSTGEPEVLAESRKVFNLFADPGERADDGTINKIGYEPTVIHENDF
jgi:hypothetical protein